MLFNRVITYTAVVSMLSACATGAGQVAAGGALGAAAGAGTGALVGSAISRGDIAASALLGGAIGLPVGLAIGYAMKRQSDEEKEEALIRQYIETQEAIKRQEQEIIRLREEAMADIPENNLDFDRREDVYSGPTLHVPTRN